MQTILPVGFYTALGTPLDDSGNVVAESLRTQTRMQIRAGAAGVLVLGTMGIQAYVKQEQCPVAVAAAASAIGESGALAENRPALLAGVMDNSVARVLRRIEALADSKPDAVVVTTPFYGVCGEKALESFFVQIADRSPFPVVLYDLPGVTKMKITFPLLRNIAGHANLAGIKTGDIVLVRSILRCTEIRDVFTPVFSGLDVFDVASAYGVDRFLDGMFACCPETTRRMFDHFRDGRVAEGGVELDRILDLRDTMFRYGIFPAFSDAMNRLGLPGNHAPDYEPSELAEGGDVLRGKMIEMNEIERGGAAT